ncbi:substrate-binding domain-containing protein [Streptomyces sp. YIM S03343]
MATHNAPQRRPTAQDVADAAGVSRATVGFVLNDTPSQTISEPTRRAVLAAAERLGYVPSAAARTLRSGRSRLVLCLVPPWATTEALSDFVQRTAAELHALGYVTVTHVTTTSSLRDLLAAASPAAVISLAPVEPAEEARLRTLRIPYVHGYLLDYPGHPHSLPLTQQAMGALQASHLRERGFERLVYVQPTDVGHPGRADGRHTGVLTGAGGLPVERVVYADAEALAALVRAWADDPRRTGVCAFDDLTALELLAALDGAGVDVPGRVGVVGVDDSSAAPFAHPPLTSVRLNLASQSRDLAARAHAAVRRGTAAPADTPDTTAPTADEPTARIVPRASA